MLYCNPLSDIENLILLDFFTILEFCMSMVAGSFVEKWMIHQKGIFYIRFD